MRYTGNVARMGHMSFIYRILVEKFERKKQYGRPMHRWENNIKIDPKEIGYEGMYWSPVAQYWNQWRAFMNTL
jgi:hypothetical protein